MVRPAQLSRDMRTPYDFEDEDEDDDDGFDPDDDSGPSNHLYDRYDNL